MLLKGTDYGHVDEEPNTTIKIVDDDRFNFCNDDLPTAYIWGLVEMIG